MTEPLPAETPTREDVRDYLLEHVVDSTEAAKIVGLAYRSALHYHVQRDEPGNRGTLIPVGHLGRGTQFLRRDVEELRDELNDRGWGRRRLRHNEKKDDRNV